MVKITIRLPDELHKPVVDTSKQNRRSLNSEIVRAIEYYLKNAPEAHYDAAEKPAEKVKEKSE